MTKYQYSDTAGYGYPRSHGRFFGRNTYDIRMTFLERASWCGLKNELEPISLEGVIPTIQVRREKQKEVGCLYCMCVCEATLVMGETFLGASF